MSNIASYTSRDAYLAPSEIADRIRKAGSKRMAADSMMGTERRCA